MRWFGRLLCSVVVGFLVLANVPSSRASRDFVAEPRQTFTNLEVLVFEAEACSYCEIFRRDVAPRYRFAQLASQAPLRFVDINKVDPEKIGLLARLDVLPTTVLMKGGREIERISGLTHPETYLRVLQHLINKNE